MSFISVLFIVLLLGGILYTIGSIFFDIGKYFFEQYSRTAAGLKPLSRERKAILAKYFFYYNRLSIRDKRKFEYRVNRFLHSKSFIGRGLEITEEMKVLISASAIKITFGLPFLYLSNFYKIAVYPDAYYSRINQNYHYGEVNPRLGIILLSWKNFVDGYLDNDDNRNLGIHEMAHALHFENKIRNDEHNFLHPWLLQKWDALAAREMAKIRRGEQHFFREYAGTNEYEFFAVSMEYFFESPHEYLLHLPELFEVKSLLLQQNPIKLYGL